MKFLDLIFVAQGGAVPTIPVDVIEMLRMGLIGLAGLTIILGWILYYLLLKGEDSRSIPVRARAIGSYQKWSYAVFIGFVAVELLKHFVAPARPPNGSVTAKFSIPPLAEDSETRYAKVEIYPNDGSAAIFPSARPIPITVKENEVITVNLRSLTEILDTLKSNAVESQSPNLQASKPR